jgi:RNA polymerase sigma factor (sigma-70 family)
MSRRPPVTVLPEEQVEDMGGAGGAGAAIDDAEIELFLVRIRPQLGRILQRYRIPYQDAEDLLQEALLAAVGKWDTIRSKDAWLAATLSRKCALYWRTRLRRRVEEVDAARLEDLAPPQRAGQERIDHLRDLRRLLATLEGRHRALVLLRYGAGLSPLEVAERLGYHEASIRKLACRSMARLQKALATSRSPAGRAGRAGGG